MHKVHTRHSRKQKKQKNMDVEQESNPIIWVLVVVAILLISIASYGIWYSGVKKPIGPTVTVYKSPTCGCCKKWVKHLESEGFAVNAYDVQEMDEIKKRFGVTRQHQSCHTALVDGYVIEGHVPADDIKRLLTEKPKVKGLSVPGMPMGSPGMEGRTADHYEVLSFDKGNQHAVFNTYN